jgi:hypothetical protein
MAGDRRVDRSAARACAVSSCSGLGRARLARQWVASPCPAVGVAATRKALGPPAAPVSDRSGRLRVIDTLFIYCANFLCPCPSPLTESSAPPREWLRHDAACAHRRYDLQFEDIDSRGEHENQKCSEEFASPSSKHADVQRSLRIGARSHSCPLPPEIAASPPLTPLTGPLELFPVPKALFFSRRAALPRTELVYAS